MMGLRQATRALHHAAEQHPIGAAMADGSIRADWWGLWIQSLLRIHLALDPYMPAPLHRWRQLAEDAADPRLPELLPIDGFAAAYAGTLTTDAARLAAGYVFTGAHLMGGAITQRALAGRLPAAHLAWTNRPVALETWRPWREAEGVEREGQAAFGAVLNIMDEIVWACQSWTAR